MAASHEAQALDYDAIIIGAGISGLYQLYPPWHSSNAIEMLRTPGRSLIV